MDVDIEIEGEVLIVKAAGTVTYDTALKLFIDASDRSAERQMRKILVNCLALSGALSTIERYRLGVTVSEYLQSREVIPRIALVGIPPTMNGFGATVAQNRGTITQLFQTQDEALNWLLSSGR